MAIKYTHEKSTASVTMRLFLAVSAGVAALIISGSLLVWYIAPMIGWIVATLVYVGWMWLTIRRLDDSETKDFALREDPSRRVGDGVLVVASLASLAAVGSVLINAGNGSMGSHLAQIGLSVFSVVMSWALVHTIFMLRYAELYFRSSRPAVDFPGSDSPTFRDFGYLAFTIGMTFQTSDTGFQSTDARALAVRHALFSYIFGTVIVAITINLVAGLSN